VSRKAIAVAGLSALAIAASGCSKDSDPEAESPPATTTEQVETQRPAPPAVDIARFRAAFKKRYETAPSALLWYHHVTRMEMVDGSLEIATDLAPPDSSSVGPEICQAASNLAIDLGELGDGIKWVTVMGSDGVGLGSCA
jgi:hypothetical protein